MSDHPLLAPLIGNAPLRQRLRDAVDQRRLHHCLLFEGPAGVGKRLAAIQLALYANCSAEIEAAAQPALSFFAARPPPPARPCGRCRACQPALAGSHPDLIVVGTDPEKITRVISADQARRLIGALALQRHSAPHRFVILDPADALNEEAANALLKTLEEPPEGTRFILVTDRPAGLLQTIRSRCQRIRFRPVPPVELRPWLEQRGADPDLADRAQGSPGLALQLAESGPPGLDLLDGLARLPGQPIHQLFAYTESLGKKAEGGGEKTTQIVDLLEELLRDTVLVAQRRPAAVLHRDRLSLLDSWAAALYPGGVGRMQEALGDARERLRLNVNGRVVLEALLSRLAQELSR